MTRTSVNGGSERVRPLVLTAAILAMIGTDISFAHACSRYYEGNGYDKGTPLNYRGPDRVVLTRNARARASFRAINNWEAKVAAYAPTYVASWKQASNAEVRCEFQDEVIPGGQEYETGWVKCKASARSCVRTLNPARSTPAPKVRQR